VPDCQELVWLVSAGCGHVLAKVRDLIVRHGVVVGLALIAVLVPFLTGSGQERVPQIVSSTWLRSVSAPSEAAYACADGDECAGDVVEEVVPTASPSPVAEQNAVEPVEAQSLAEPESTPVPVRWATMEVRQGDTLSELAQWFGVSALSIAAANGAGLEDFIQVGDTLVIPVVESEFVMPPEPVPPTEPPTPTPEPTIVITPTPTPFVVSGPQDVIDAICSFPWPCDQMVRIATCESGLNPNAFNPAGYYGLFQINYEFDGWNDPLVNSQVAYETKYLPALASGDPFLPWPACRHY
jgi:LysM repeat protein